MRRRAVLNNRGVGGNSKLKVDAQPPAAGIAAAQQAPVANLANPAPDGVPQPLYHFPIIRIGGPPQPNVPVQPPVPPPPAVVQNVWQGPQQQVAVQPAVVPRDPQTPFIVSAIPINMKVFNSSEPDNLCYYDMHGEPFCGVVAIDAAAGYRNESFGHYVNMLFANYYNSEEDDVNRALDVADVGVISALVGTNDFLARYAASKSLNLRINTVLPGVYSHHLNNPSFDWVVLYFEADPNGGVGHYLLGIDPNNSTDEKFNMPEPPEPSWEPVIGWSFWKRSLAVTAAVCAVAVLHVPIVSAAVIMCVKAVSSTKVGMAYNAVSTAALGVFKKKKISKGRRLLAPSNLDERHIVDRREPLRYQDSIRKVLVTTQLSFFGLIRDIPNPRQRNLRNFMVYLGVAPLEYDVSEPRFLRIYTEMVSLHINGKDCLMALGSIAQLRELNLSHNNGKVLLDTAAVLKEYASRFEDVDREPRPAGEIVGYNADGQYSYFKDPQVVVAAQAQNNVVGGALRQNFICNHFLNIKSQKPDVKAICAAPIGVPSSDEGLMGPGLFSLTDSPSLVSAFAGRSMLGPSVYDETVLDFIRFSQTFCDFFEERTEVPYGEPDPVKHFVSHYSSRRPRKWIDRAVSRYYEFIEGKMSAQQRSKFCSHSAFVKFESNIKNENNKYYVRPRLIMMMSEWLMWKCVSVTNLLDAWNVGPFQRFQVKHVTVEEMIEKITLATSRDHLITDYSSFESSISQLVRTLEIRVLSRLCSRAGYTNCLEGLETIKGFRTLKCKYATMNIDTRCSGDFWTSFGNGLVNVCINAYVAHLKGINVFHQSFSMIAEGDDGIISSALSNPPLVNALGFKFSSALRGYEPGDCDFLKSLWVNGNRHLNIGRCLSVLWVKGANHLKYSKRLFLLRAAACSLHYLSPGHPVLYELVNLIGRKTAGASPFKNWQEYMDRWKELPDVSKYPRNVVCNENMRCVVAEGACDFPAVSYTAQLLLESRIRQSSLGDFYVGTLLSANSDFTDRVRTYPVNNSTNLTNNNSSPYYRILGSFDVLGVKVRRDNYAEGQIQTELPGIGSLMATPAVVAVLRGR